MTPYYDNGIVQLYQADARDLPLADQSVHCVVTSPPYFGLRVYQDNDDRGIGLEPNIDVYVANLLEVFAEVKRVLREDGVIWVNLGDSYGAGTRTSRPAGAKQATNAGSVDIDRNGEPSGDRLGIPERVVMALQTDGWVWRDTIIWAKKSAMPESVNGWRWERCRVKVASDPIRKRDGLGPAPGGEISTMNGAVWSDCPSCPKCGANNGLVLRKGSWRTTSSHEMIYMLTKGMGYFCDAEAVKTAQTGNAHSRGSEGGNAAYQTARDSFHGWSSPAVDVGGANRRSVWNDISPEPYGGPHFATFPSDLPRICIQASTSERGVCPKCGRQWARIVEHKNMEIDRTDWGDEAGNRTASSGTMTAPAESKTIGWRTTCSCDAGNPIPATVLDPFCGTATSMLAAQKLGRRAVGVDISESYLKQAVKRLSGVPLPMMI